MKRLLYFLLFVLFAVGLIGNSYVFAANDEYIYDLNFESEEQQRFSEWGAHFFVDANPTQFNLSKANPAMFAQTVRDCNMTIHRMNFNQKYVYDADGNFHPEVVDAYAKNLLIPLAENGCGRYIYCSWRPNEPHRYKDASNRNRIYEDHEDQYVAEVVNMLSYMKEKGYPLPVVFSVQNEPDGAHVPLDQFMRLSIKFDKALEEAGLGDILIAGPDVSSVSAGHGSYWGKEFSTFDNNPEFAKAIDLINYHAYGNHAANGPEIAESFRKGLEKYHYRAWQTEVSTISSGAPTCRTKGGGNFFLGHSILMFEKLCGDFAWLNCDTWLWFMATNSYDYLFTEKDSVFAYGGEQAQAMIYGGRGADGVNSFQRYPTGDMLQILFKNVESGSFVHRLNSDDPDLHWQISTNVQTVGFKNSKKTTIILLNPSGKTKKYNVKNISGKSAKVYSVSEGAWQTVAEDNYNVIDNMAEKVVIKPYSTNIIVITDEDNAAPVINVDMKDSAFKESDGTFYVRDTDLNITGTVDEEALVSVNGAKGFTNSERRFSINRKINKDTEYTLTATDQYGNSSDPVKVLIKYNPNYVGIAYDEYDTICNKEIYTLNGFSNTEGKFVIDGKTAEIGDDHKFSVDLPLEEGENTFEGIVYDNNGHYSNKAKINIFCDSIAPKIDLKRVKTETNQRYQLLQGTVSEPVESFTINGENVDLKDDLSFVYILSAKEGDNVCKIAAVDGFGNVGENNVDIKYTVDSKTSHKINGVAYVKKIDSEVKIDGVLDEKDWNIDLLADKNALQDPTMTIRFGMMWDSNNLYIAAIVDDDKVAYGHQYAYANDSVEMLFNPSNEKAGTWVPGDIQLFSGYVNSELTFHQNSKPITSGWTITDDGYVAEIAVPWTTIGLSPKSGLKIGFDLNVNDSDVPKVRNGIITWQGTANNYLTTEDFGTIVLVDNAESVIYDDVTDDTPDTSDTLDTPEDIRIEKDVVKVYVNNIPTKTKNMPVLENGKLRISIDTLLEVSGIEHVWQNENLVVIKTVFGDMNVEADNPTVQIGIHPDIVDVTPYKIDGGIYVGIDFAEKYSSGYFDIGFSYDEKTKSIYFTTNGRKGEEYDEE